MADSNAVPVIVHSVAREAAEQLNSLLRNDGMAVHCTWIPDLADVPDALEQLNPEMLVAVSVSEEQLTELATLRDRMAASVPLLVVRDAVSDAIIAADMVRGARDTIALALVERARAVVRRELRAFRLERTLTSTLRTAQDFRNQLESVMRRSRDAIAYIQEGIVVEASAAWLELFGFADRAAIIGQPIMDLFAEDAKAALRGALAACLQGRWKDHALKASARLTGGSMVPLELVLHLAEHEGDPCVQLIVPANARDEQQLERQLTDAVHRDDVTGLWTRRQLLKAIGDRLATDAPGGSRYLLCIRPDNLAALEREHGLFGAEHIMAQLSAQLTALTAPSDLAGHLSGSTLLLLLERGNQRDAEAWCEAFLKRVASHDFQAAGRRVKLSCSLGMCTVPAARADLSAMVLETLDGMRRARQRGGNQLAQNVGVDQDTRVQAYDEVWERHIKSALLENRFRLVQQPIASLNGEKVSMFDVAVRMLDPQQKEVLPAEFMPAAARSNLLKNIDRWVLGASLSLAAKLRPDLLFVRLTRDSLLDDSLIGWIDTQLKATQADPQRICIELTEATVEAHPAETARIAQALRERRMRIALEHFGAGHGSQRLLAEVQPEFVKIDGALMQGIAGNPDLQSKVGALVAAAGNLNVQTVAERIEDANTMAVVWQLGVQYIQGYLVHAPEDVVLTS